MNAKQRRQIRKYAVRVFAEVAADLTKDSTAATLIETQANLARIEASMKVRFKMGDQFGSTLCGHWFHLIPADDHAREALDTYMQGEM